MSTEKSPSSMLLFDLKCILKSIVIIISIHFESRHNNHQKLENASVKNL